MPLQTAQQLASQVNLSRAALVHSDAIARMSLLKTMSDQEGVRIVPREPSDQLRDQQSTTRSTASGMAVAQAPGP